MNCDKVHRIINTNIESSEKITNSIFLLKGIIENFCETATLYVKNNNQPISAECICLSNTKDGKFKCIIRLLEDQVNRIELNYCGSSSEIEIIHANNPKTYTVVPLYIICRGHNGDFQSDDILNNSPEIACKKITLGLELIQTLISEKLYEKNFDRKTFVLETECKPFYSELEMSDVHQMNEDELWIQFAREILKVNCDKPGEEYKKYIAFIGCTHFEGITTDDYSYANIIDKTKGNAALGGGGFALFGTGCLYTWPNIIEEVYNCFSNSKRVDLTKLLDDSNYRRNYGGCFSTTLGAVCHELCHTFDLGHTQDGIMGNGFDYMNLFFTISNKTEDLPKRITERLEATTINSKLTKIKKPGEFLSKHRMQKNNDLTFFSENCAITLSYHKWFNNSAFTSADINHQQCIRYNHDQQTIVSDESYLKLIEIRMKDTAMLIKFWSFLNEKIQSFKIPMPQLLDANNSIFAIDNFGNILKEELVRP